MNNGVNGCFSSRALIGLASVDLRGLLDAITDVKMMRVIYFLLVSAGAITVIKTVSPWMSDG
jgi:hypothetical protein